MKPVKAKSKTKKNGTKFGKVKLCTKETANSIDPDYTVLRKPVDTSVSSLHQVSKLLENGSDEVKAILAYECDIVYECRICRSLFRSLVNLISHKRVYCKEKFNITLNKSMLHNYNMAFDKDAFIHVQEPKQTALNDICKNDRILRSHVPREEKKDLTAVIDMLTRKQSTDNNVTEVPERFDNPERIIGDKNETVQELNNMNRSTMCQNVLKSTKTQSSDVKNNELGELQNAINRTPADSEGHSSEMSQVEKSDSPVQIYGSDEENGTTAEVVSVKNLPCTICNAKFSTKKTLAVHMKTLHTPHRMCYPCPCCTSTFANTWSVYRHLFKVHRKTNEQVRKLRQQIQEKAFRRETAGVEDFERDNQCNKSVLSADLTKKNDTQEWIDHLESDELQRCGGCGKRFDRKAALSSHLQYCQRRIAVCDNSNKLKKTSRAILKAQITTNNEKIPNEIVNLMDNINTKTISGEELLQPSTSNASNASSASCTSNASTSSDISGPNETMIRVQAVASLSKEDWAAMDTGQALTDDISEIDVVAISSEPIVACDEELRREYERPSSSSSSSNASDAPEIIYTNLDNSEVVTLNDGAKKRKIIDLETDSVTDSTVSEDTSRNIIQEETNSSQNTNTTDRTTLMEKKMATIANLRKLQCLPCKRKFTSMTNLRRHIAIHIGWNRYHCKLCDFKCFAKCDCVAHCNKIHNAQNNRNVIAEMVVEIPQDQYTCNQTIVMDITNIEDTVTDADPVVVEITPIEDSNAHISETNLNIKNEKHMNTSNNNDTPVETSVSNNKQINQIGQENSENSETNKDQETDKSNANSQRILDSNPDLRRLVMEVIFGSESNSSKQSASEKTNSEDDENKNEEARRQLLESSDSPIHTKYIRKRAKKIALEKSKPQRPVRNRVKPVNKDFIYDLKEVAFRREYTKGSYRTFHKKVTPRVQSNEYNAKIQTEELQKFLSEDNAPIRLSGSDELKHKTGFKMTAVNSTIVEKPVAFSDAAKITILPKNDITCMEN